MNVPEERHYFPTFWDKVSCHTELVGQSFKVFVFFSYYVIKRSFWANIATFSRSFFNLTLVFHVGHCFSESERYDACHSQGLQYDLIKKSMFPVN